MARGKILNPDLVYLQGNTLIPSKALSYKIDEKTGKVIEVIRPRTRQYEKQLKEDLRTRLNNVKIFPTRKSVFVSIEHIINSRIEFKKCDLDNRAKLILDAMRGVIYKDDLQVKMLWSSKKFLKNGQESSFRISVKILNQASLNKIQSIIKKIN